MEIPLKVLICDSDPAASRVLKQVLVDEEDVLEWTVTSTIPDAHIALKQKDINTIFIDPIPFGIGEGSDFIFNVRKASPEIVFVLYINKSVVENQRAEFYRGERRRLSHYYSLDKETPIAAFVEELRAVLRSCQNDLRYRMSESSLERLRKEARQLKENSPRGNADLLVKNLEEMLSRTTPAKQPEVRKNTVFLSYRFAEEEYVTGLTRLLKEQGFEIVTGESANTYISKAILDRINQCEFFLCLMTRNHPKADGTFTTSPWLIEEKGAALAYGKRLVLMVEEGVTDIGGLQGDWQQLRFGPKGFLNAAYKAVDQLNSYAGGG